MKKVIRNSVFETNSSSTHSLTMCTKEVFEKWKNGELLFDKYKGAFVEPMSYTEEELKKEYFKYKIKKINNGILFNDTYYKDLNDLISKVEVSESDLKKTARSMDEDLCDYESYWEYDGWSNLEGFENSYTTPNGETIVAFGKYGYDG